MNLSSWNFSSLVVERAQKVYGFLVDNRDKVCNSVAGSQSETQKLAKNILKLVVGKDRTYLFIARTRTYPTFWPSFVRTYLPTPTDLFGFLNIDFTKKLPKIVFFLKFTTMDIV